MNMSNKLKRNEWCKRRVEEHAERMGRRNKEEAPVREHEMRRKLR